MQLKESKMSSIMTLIQNLLKIISIQFFWIVLLCHQLRRSINLQYLHRRNLQARSFLIHLKHLPQTHLEYRLSSFLNHDWVCFLKISIIFFSIYAHFTILKFTYLQIYTHIRHSQFTSWNIITYIRQCCRENKNTGTVFILKLLN